MKCLQGVTFQWNFRHGNVHDNKCLASASVFNPHQVRLERVSIFSTGKLRTGAIKDEGAKMETVTLIPYAILPRKKL